MNEDTHPFILDAWRAAVNSFAYEAAAYIASRTGRHITAARRQGDLSEVKDLCGADVMLRCAQHDVCGLRSA